LKSPAGLKVCAEWLSAIHNLSTICLWPRAKTHSGYSKK
jgi:hypothetical protein